MKNLFSPLELPPGDQEFVEEILKEKDLRIERIISHGQTTRPCEWYDQDENEWVILLQGSARLSFEDGSVHEMVEGTYCYLPAHVRHRVDYTSSEPPCIWLALFWKSA